MTKKPAWAVILPNGKWAVACHKCDYITVVAPENIYKVVQRELPKELE